MLGRIPGVFPGRTHDYQELTAVQHYSFDKACHIAPLKPLPAAEQLWDTAFMGEGPRLPDPPVFTIHWNQPRFEWQGVMN
jgi:hypothetical protein